jgi:hypothetical protein
LISASTAAAAVLAGLADVLGEADAEAVRVGLGVPGLPGLAGVLGLGDVGRVGLGLGLTGRDDDEADDDGRGVGRLVREGAVEAGGIVAVLMYAGDSAHGAPTALAALGALAAEPHTPVACWAVTTPCARAEVEAAGVRAR